MNRMRSAMCMTAAIMFAAATMAAQDAADKTADKMDKKEQSVTGCVQAGSAAGTYMLTNAMPATGDKMATDTMSASKADMGSVTLTGDRRGSRAARRAQGDRHRIDDGEDEAR